MSGAIPEQAEVGAPRGVARYYVLRVYTIDGNMDPGLVSVTAGPFVDFLNAWYSAGAIRRCYPDQIFIAGAM
jgi:hypothetical protein